MNLTDLVNSYLQNPKHQVGERGRLAYYPSEASCTKEDGKIIGACLRQLYYSWTNVPKTNPDDAHSIRRMAIGKAIEEMEVARYMQMGICAGKSVKFYLPELNVSGEVDAFVYDFDLDNLGYPLIKRPPSVVGIELKSAYGYKFQKNVSSIIKEEHLLQVMLYIKRFGCLFKLIYLSLDNPSFKMEYDIILSDKGHPVINGELSKSVSFDGIVKRWNTLGMYLSKPEIPPKDYVWRYTDEEVERRFKAKEVSKYAYDKWKKGKKIIGDWQCLYCAWKNLCWELKAPIIEEEGEEENE